MYKIFWALRAVLYKPFFGKFEMPGYIGKPTFLGNTKNIFISKRVRIFPNTRMEVVGKNAKLMISDNVSIGQNVHITCGGVLEIGQSTTILANTFVTDIDHSYEEIDVPILSQENIVKKTVIGENCFIGIGVAIQAGTILGKQCIVGTNSVVRGVFPDYCVIAGVPARIIKRYNLNTQKWEKVNYK